MSWYKESKKAEFKTVIAQAVELINDDDVLGVIHSFGTRRFVIGFRKNDGSFRMMNVQRSVQRPYQKENADNRPSGGSFPINTSSYLTVYDLQKASEIARKSIADVDVNELDPELLKQAYRRIHPDAIEFIKGDGKVYVVRYRQYSFDNGLNEEE